MAMKIEEKVIESFDFRCPYCKGEDLTVVPLGLTYTYRKNNDNTDIRDEQIKKLYDSTPYIGNVLMECGMENMLFTCGECKISFTPRKQVIKTEMSSFLKKKDMSPIMVVN